MTTIAATEFVQRSKEYKTEEDGTNFYGWYHVDDIKRILWSKFNALNAEAAKDTIQPYVFFDGLDTFTLEEMIMPLANHLKASDKKYYPFIFKPELASVHYMAGFLRKNVDESLSLFIFNPTGRAPRVEHGSLDKELRMINSPHQVQSSERDGGPLVSCGPLSIAFIEYAINNPDYMANLDETFRLPTALNLTDTSYTDFVMNLRSGHQQLLDTIKDEVLDDIEECYTSMTQNILDSRGTKKPAAYADDYFDDLLSYGDELPSYDDSFQDDTEEESDHSGLSEEDLVKDKIRPEEIAHPIKSSEIKPLALESETSLSSLSSLPVIDLAGREDIKSVTKEIERLQKNASSFFSIGNTKKAKLIEEALADALKRQVTEVRKDSKVIEALSHHRIFGFFGCKLADAVTHVEASLQKEKSSFIK